MTHQHMIRLRDDAYVMSSPDESSPEDNEAHQHTFLRKSFRLKLPGVTAALRLKGFTKKSYSSKNHYHQLPGLPPSAKIVGNAIWWPNEVED